MNTRKPSQDRKSEILTAAMDLAFKVGPDHVTTGMIAGALGLTQPAIYKHFPKKEEVWQAVCEVLRARIFRNIEACNQTDQRPIDRVRQLVLSHLQLIAEAPALPEIMVARDPTGTLTDGRRCIQSAMSKLRLAMTHELDHACTAGQLRAGMRTEDGVALLVGVIQSLALRLIVTHNPTHLVKDGERLLDLQLSLFSDKGEAT